jgi:hypothetical protein
MTFQSKIHGLKIICNKPFLIVYLVSVCRYSVTFTSYIVQFLDTMYLSEDNIVFPE